MADPDKADGLGTASLAAEMTRSHTLEVTLDGTGPRTRDRSGGVVEELERLRATRDRLGDGA